MVIDYISVKLYFAIDLWRKFWWLLERNIQVILIWWKMTAEVYVLIIINYWKLSRTHVVEIENIMNDVEVSRDMFNVI